MTENPFKTGSVLADASSQQCQPNPPRRILVVEDEPLIRRLNSEMLIDSGYHVDVAEDGVIAWDALLLNDYDLVVTDNSMPNLSGVQLIERLHTARMAMPVIMATATLPQEEFTRCPWLQPDAILLKPYSLAEFLGAVKDVLNASADVREGIAPLPIWQTLPSAMTLRL